MFNLLNEKEKYLYYCKQFKNLSAKTIKAYNIDLKQFCNFVNSTNCFNKQTLLDYINRMYSSYKPKSAKRKIACVKAFYRYLETEDIIEINPFHKIIIKHKEPANLPKTIPLDYVKNILNYSYEQYYSAVTEYQIGIRLRNTIIIELLFFTGMRVSEVSNLKKADINITNNSIRIFGKGSKERIMCINNNISKLMCLYFTNYNTSSEYVFVNKLHNKLSEQSIRFMLKDYTNAIGITMHITPHMFRHTFATELHNQNVDIRYIQQFLGHSSISTTQIYTYVSSNKIQEILDAKHPRNYMNIAALRFT